MVGRSRLSRRWPALLALAVLTAGCGSTVEERYTTAQAGLGAPGSQSLSAPSAGSGGGSVGGAGTGGATSGGGSVAGGSTTGGALSGGSAGGGAAASGSAGNGMASLVSQVRSGHGPVVVRIGVIYENGLDSAYKAAGASSSTTDSQADYQAVIKSINSRPHSRLRLAASYFAVNAASTQPQSDQLQAGCDHFAFDVHVSIVLSYSAGSQQGLASCLQQHGILLIDGMPGAESAGAGFSHHPLMFAPSQLSLDQVGSLEPSYLIRHGWANSRWGGTASCATVKQSRIGVITFARPDWESVYYHDIKPTFARLGHPVYDVRFVSVSGSTAQQLAQASSATQNAVLRFAGECIDHVAFVANVALDYLFMDDAQQQHYSPRYGLSSLEAPPVIVQNLPAGANTQLRGSMGPGWSPYSDVNIPQFDATAARPAAACGAILKRAGLEPGDNNSWILALPACDGPFFAAAMLDRWIASGARGSLDAAADAIGGGYQPSGSYGARIDARDHAGADEYRAIAFDTGCTCFRYTSSLQRIS